MRPMTSTPETHHTIRVNPYTLKPNLTQLLPRTMHLKAHLKNLNLNDLIRDPALATPLCNYCHSNCYDKAELLFP